MLIGTLVRFEAEWRVPATDAGVLTDPTTVTLTVQDPAGVEVTYTYLSGDGVIVRDGTGRFHADYLPALAGTYEWRWAGTGAAHAPAEGRFKVRPSGL